MPDDIHTNFEIEGQDEGKTPVITTEPQEDAEEISPPPLWKQATGGIVGALIALAVYSFYEAASPIVTAWIAGDDTVAEQTADTQVSTSGRKQRNEVQE